MLQQSHHGQQSVDQSRQNGFAIDNDVISMPPPVVGVLSHAAIRLSVCLSVCLSQRASALGAQLPWAIATAGHQRCADCGPVRGRT